MSDDLPPGPTQPYRPGDPDRIADIVASLAEHSAADWKTTVEAACVAHPEQAEEIRRRFGIAESTSALHPLGSRGHEQLGKFRLLKQIGMGGMGRVFLAEQPTAPRRVALKVIREDYLHVEQVQQRFQREIEAAAALDHPAICPVYESGEIDGLPYVAMRYLEGQTLADRLHQQRRPPTLPPASRDEVAAVVLMIEKLARALHEAHETGIIHRDIKPGNIMITAGDEPVILDFGLARPEEETGLSITAPGQAPGTVPYMSAEQLRPRGRHLDRRTDVYSLAVVLFECLTLRLPFYAATHEEIREQILRAPEPNCQSLNRAIPPDLKIVIETGMERDRDRRYATALAFADDLQCVRQFQPIRARPTGLGLRSRRWAQRNPVLVGVMTTLLLGLCAFAWQWWRAELRSEEATRRSEDFVGLAREAIFDIHDHIRDTQASLQARRHLLGVALEYLERLETELDSPAANAALPAGYVRTGDVQTSLGEIGAALASYEKALHLTEATPDSMSKNHELCVAHLKIATAQMSFGQLDGADQHCRAAETCTDRQLELTPDDPRTRQYRSAVLETSGKIAELRGDLSRALDLHEKSTEIRRDLLGERPDEERVKRDLAVSLGFVARIEQRLGRPRRALAHLEEGTALCEALAEAQPESLLAKLDVSMAHQEVAAVLIDLEQLQDAASRYAVAISIARQLHETDATNAEVRRHLAVCLDELASVELSHGETEATLQHAGESVQHFEALAASSPNTPGVQRALLLGILTLAHAQEARNRLKASLQNLRRAHAIAERLVEEQPDGVQARYDLTACDQRLGHFFLGGSGDATDRVLNALPYCQSVLQNLQWIVERSPDDVDARHELIRAHNSVAELSDFVGERAEANANLTAALALGEAWSSSQPENPRARLAIVDTLWMWVQTLGQRLEQSSLDGPERAAAQALAQQHRSRCRDILTTLESEQLLPAEYAEKLAALNQ